jgi:hypothetical protein
MLSVCLCIPAINFWIAQPVFVKFGMNIMAPVTFSMAYFTNSSDQSVCIFEYPLLLLGNGSIKIALPLLGNGSVK